MAHVSLSVIFILVSTTLSQAIINNSTDELLDVRITSPEDAEVLPVSYDKCHNTLHASLEKLRKRQSSHRASSLIDLSGYALHQSLRNAPVDMYVTDIKVRAPSVGSWVQVQGCKFSRNAEMRTHLLFSDLLVSGLVRLVPGEFPVGGELPPSSEPCTMTLRLRRAGLDLRAAPELPGGAKGDEPYRGLQVRTESNFVDPHFLSVHAYGCKLDQWAKEGWLDVTGPYSRQSSRRRSRTQESEPEIRIMSLGEEPELERGFNNEALLQKLQTYVTPAEKIAAVLKVKNQIAQQSNTVFQTHGPFSQDSSPTTERPIFTPTKHHQRPSLSVSSITELDDHLRPIGPVPQQPFQAFVSPTPLPKLPLFAATNQPIYSPTNQPIYSPSNQPVYSAPNQPLQDVSSEMEDVFLRGAKALLSKYLEKQLEVPLKEALMTKIGYTVSYG